MKTILVTGASGFVGRQTLPLLAARGYKVHAVAGSTPLSIQGVEWHVNNLLQFSETLNLLAEVRPTHLLHLAWYAKPGSFWNACQNFDWLSASMRLLEGFARCGGRRVVGLGTCAEYDWSASTPFHERFTPLRPGSLYGAAKASLGWMQAHMALQYRFKQTWCRAFLLYGPHEAQERLVPSIVIPLLKGEIALCRDSHAVRDLIHIKDLAEALATVLDSDYEGEINLGSGDAVHLSHVAQALGTIIGRPELVKLGNSPGDPPVLVADTSTLKSLGFRPAYQLQAGLAESVEWWRACIASESCGNDRNTQTSKM